MGSVFPDRKALILVIVASLGYFVDIYDLILFNIVKSDSLEYIKALHSLDFDVKKEGIFLFNMQMFGMLVGGILWGILGDKKGRITVLFGSIFLYSFANLANAFTTDLTFYAVIRFIAGVGLAGELGAGITLVAETLHKEKRGYGTMIIVTFGALGAVLATQVADKGAWMSDIIYSISEYRLQNWQVAYVVGGLLGLVLLLLRAGTLESGMFRSLKDSKVKKGNFMILLSSKKNFLKYLKCILIGIPIWFIIGVPIALSSEYFAEAIGVPGISRPTAIMYAYIGLSVGDLISGLISQFLKSRKKVVYIYLTSSVILLLVFFYGMQGASHSMFYFVCFLLGCATGYWAIFVTISAEQFGTNIRSTVTNTVPNFVRGTVPLITLSFTALIPSFDAIGAALIVGGTCIAVAFWAAWSIKESFSEDLDYVEEC